MYPCGQGSATVLSVNGQLKDEEWGAVVGAFLDLTEKFAGGWWLRRRLSKKEEKRKKKEDDR
jgi:hypothetical protein